MCRELLLLIVITTIVPHAYAQPASQANTIIYHTNFDTKDYWGGGTGDNAVYSYGVNDGIFLMTGKTATANSLIYKEIFIDVNKDFSIETAAEYYTGPNNYSYGLIFGGKDFSNAYHFGVSPNGNFTFFYYFQGTPKIVIPWTVSNAIKQGSHVKNVLKIEKIANRLLFYINGIKVTETTNGGFFGNNIGFMLSLSQSVAYHYLTVKYLQDKKELPQTQKTDNTAAAKLVDQAIQFQNEGKNDQAIAYANKAMAINPKNETAWLVRGVAYHNTEKYDLALQDYSMAISLNPSYALAFQNRAILYDFKQQYANAVKDHTAAIRLSPKDSLSYSQRAISYSNLNQWDLALQDCSEAIRLAPGNAQYLISRGFIYTEQNRYEEAIQDYTKALQLEPKNIYALNGRGYTYRYTRQDALALADYSMAIRLAPNDANAYDSRGEYYLSKGNYELAIADFSKCLTLDDKSSFAYIHIISPLVRTQDFTKAKEYYSQYVNRGFTSFINTDPSWKFYKSFLVAAIENIPSGMYLQALANLDKAINEYGTEIKEKNKTGFSDILALKGFVLTKLNKTAEAKDVYNQALIINAAQPDVKLEIAAIEKKLTVIAQADIIPPVIELISPQPSRGFKIVAADEQTQLVGKARDASGIASIEINGKAVNAEEDGLFVTALTLHEGNNEIVITATDKRGNKASKSFTIAGSAVSKKDIAQSEIVTPPEEIQPGFHAILIAEKDYQDSAIPDLENPVKDAQDLKIILQEHYTFDPKDIDTLYNKSREEIMQAIVQKCNSLTENDNLLIFYAGHGIAEKDKFGGVDGYWVPSSAKFGLNASYISSDDINKALKRSNSKHILVIADACFSGSFTRELPANAPVGIQKQYNVASRKIMASGNLEPVPDNSRFIYYLKKNLSENKDKFMSGKKLFDSFYEAILNNSDTSPQYAAIKNVGDEGGEFIFIKR
ncbi:MAG: tetratricopeptide repeat protein [Ferruginibacter sp.]